MAFGAAVAKCRLLAEIHALIGLDIVFYTSEEAQRFG